MQLEYQSTWHRARKELGLNPIEYLVADLIYHDSNKNGWSTTPQSEIAAQYDVGERSVRRYISNLKKKKLIVSKKGGFGYKTTKLWVESTLEAKGDFNDKSKRGKEAKLASFDKKSDTPNEANLASGQANLASLSDLHHDVLKNKEGVVGEHPAPPPPTTPDKNEPCENGNFEPPPKDNSQPNRPPVAAAPLGGPPPPSRPKSDDPALSYGGRAFLAEEMKPLLKLDLMCLSVWQKNMSNDDRPQFESSIDEFLEFCKLDPAKSFRCYGEYRMHYSNWLPSRILGKRTFTVTTTKLNQMAEKNRKYAQPTTGNRAYGINER